MSTIEAFVSELQARGVDLDCSCDGGLSWGPPDVEITEDEVARLHEHHKQVVAILEREFNRRDQRTATLCRAASTSIELLMAGMRSAAAEGGAGSSQDRGGAGESV